MAISGGPAYNTNNPAAQPPRRSWPGPAFVMVSSAPAHNTTARHGGAPYKDPGKVENMGEQQEGQELAETLGRKIVTIELAGQTFTLRQLNLNDLVELEQHGGGDLQQTQCELWLAAKRGGYQGSLEEIAGLVEWEALEEVVEPALKSLWPPKAQRHAQAMKDMKLALLGIEDESGGA